MRFKVYANRWRYFTTLEAAKIFCEAYFLRTGVVLGIEHAPKAK